MLGLLIAGIFGNVKQVHARILWSGEKIYIRSNGDIEWAPSTAPAPPISTTDRVHYDITGDIETTRDGIVVERSNIIINGNDHTIKGPGALTRPAAGIYIGGPTLVNVTVMRATIREYSYGIYIYGCCPSVQKHLILGNHVTNNYYGIYISSSSNNVISNIRIGVITTAESIIENNHEGIFLYDSTGNTIKGNTITSNNCGINATKSSGNTFSGNRIESNEVYGIYLHDSSNSNTILRNYIRNSRSCIRVSGSSGNSILENDIANPSCASCGPGSTGIWLYISSGNAISGNTISQTTSALYLYRSSGTIWHNAMTNNYYGLVLLQSNNNNVYNNTITSNNNCGIYLSGSNGNNIHENSITNNGNGTYLSSSSGNRFWLNNFTNNNVQVSATMEQNYWNTSYPTGGNYWSDYRGIDAKKGPNQDQSGSDGIGDTPYSINSNNIDYLPRGLYFRPPLIVPPMTPLLRIKVNILSLGAPATAPPGSRISVPMTIHYETSVPTHVLARITSGATEVWSYDFGSKDGTGDLSHTAVFNAPSSPGSYAYRLEVGHGPSLSSFTVNDSRDFSIQVPVVAKVIIVSFAAPPTASAGSSVPVPVTVHYEIIGSTSVLVSICRWTNSYWDCVWGNPDSSVSRSGTGDLSYTATFNAPSSPGSYTYEIRTCYQSAGRWDIMDRKTFRLQVISPPTSQTPTSTTQVPPPASSTTQTQSPTPQPQTSSTTQTQPPTSTTQTPTSSITQTQSPAPSSSPSQPPPSPDLMGLLLIAVVVMVLITVILLVRMRAKPPA